MSFLFGIETYWLSICLFFSRNRNVYKVEENRYRKRGKQKRRVNKFTICTTLHWSNVTHTPTMYLFPFSFYRDVAFKVKFMFVFRLSPLLSRRRRLYRCCLQWSVCMFCIKLKIFSWLFSCIGSPKVINGVWILLIRQMPIPKTISLHKLASLVVWTRNLWRFAFRKKWTHISATQLENSMDTFDQNPDHSI